MEKSTPKGPNWFSTVAKMLSMRGKDPLTFWLETHAEYGDTIKLKLGFMDIWFFAGPEAIYEVFVSQHRHMRKGIGYSGLKKLLGEGLITTDAEHWSDQRQRLNPLFTPSAINAYASSVYAACDAGMSELEELAKDSCPVDIGHAMTRLTMRIISRAAFGVDLTEGHDEIVDAFEYAFGFVADITADPVRAPLFVPTTSNQRYKKAQATIDNFIDALIEKSGSQATNDAMSQKIFRALVDNDRKLLRDEIVSLYFAGFETTARTMTFLMDLLPRNRDILDKLRNEAKKMKPPTTTADVTKLYPFATDVVNEALRLYPPVAMMARQANEDCTIDGYAIRENSLLIVCPFIAQRNKTYWPTEETYSPSASTPLQKRIRHKGAFAPFGAGPRVCLGKHFAIVELIIAISMISDRFDWELQDKNPVELDFHGTLRPKSPIMVNLSSRKPVKN